MNRAMKSGLLACAFVAVAALAASCAPTTGVVDTTKPQVLQVTVTPSEVAPGQQLTISVFATDNVGITGVTVLVRANGLPMSWCGGQALRTSGTTQSGTWERTCTVPAVVNGGTYQINTAVADARNNITVIGDTVEPTATSGHFTVVGANNDHDAPAVQSVVVTPSTVAAGGTVTISAHITDATGVKGVAFQPRRNASTPGFCIVNAVLVSGTATDGVWEKSCTIPAGTVAGAYTVNTAVSDLVDNLGYVGDGTPAPKNGAFSVTG